MMRAKPGKLNTAFGVSYGSGTNQLYANSFNILGGVNVSGNINSLVSSEFGSLNLAIRGAPYKFMALFDSCTGIADASNLVLPDIYLGYYAYQYMFWGCSNMGAGPDIWADYYDSGYAENSLDSASHNMGYMFDGCTSLHSLKLRTNLTLATTTSDSTNPKYDWVGSSAASDVPYDGVFYYNGPTTRKGLSCIPSGWTITPF